MNKLCPVKLLKPLIIILLIYIAPIQQSLAVSNVQYVIHIVVDGFAALHLKNIIDRQPETIPNITRFINEGATTLNARTDYYYTETLPDTITILTGRPVVQPPDLPDVAPHGFYYNYDIPEGTIHSLGNTNLGYIPSVFDVVHNYGLRTAFFGGKYKFDIIARSYDENNGAPDDIGEDNGRNKIDFSDVREYDTLNQILLFIEQLQSLSYNYLFLHIPELDIYGHFYGWGTPVWNNYVTVVDEWLGWIFNAIESNPQLNGNTAIVLTADHGGGSPLYTHIYPEYPLNYTIPLFVWGPGWRPGSDLYEYFSNRIDPGNSRFGYSFGLQPLRNGDSANIVLAILGFPPIPGSFMRPEFGTPPAILKYTLTPDGIRLSWEKIHSNYVLEVADSLDNPSLWRAYNGSIKILKDTFYIDILPTNKYLFLRLRNPNN